MKVELYGRTIDIGPAPSTLAQKRWSGQLSPEPETVAWLESLKRGEVLFDVGASVGTISVRAAVLGLQVVAFEPVFANYRELVEVIERNELMIMAYQLAMLDRMAVGCMGKGRSTYTFIPSSQFMLPCVVALTIDEFCGALGVRPDHIKVDVDGDDALVLKGAAETLSSVKSLLVEVDPQVWSSRSIPKFMAGYGFEFDPDQVDACRIKGGKYDGTANYIFKRREPT